ncbi:major facilitator transporter [Pseudomonas sp. M47T1]|uniref:MFS transporter n=1 Tax=Pseudomonas sp. M47T1 TaxID=1179778 RepID=UPI0002607D40|nr:MFS transporter [Pseudomonas sp. M47T1]EIK97177.1 major facilitator transporter [Pseudomonas sp. M47T1]
MNRLTLPVLLFVAAVTGICLGATAPLTALRLLEGGASAAQIGILSALPAVGMMLAASLCARLSRRFHRRQLFQACLAVCLASVALLEPARHSLYALAGLRLGMGLGMGLVIILSEAWINELSSDQRRGQSIAVYTTAYTGSQMLGPLLISLLGTDGPQVIITVSVALGLAWLTLLALDSSDVAVSEEDGVRSFSLMGFLRLAPTLCMGVLFFSFFDSVILALFPVYATANGVGPAEAALMVSVILLGDMCLQLPLGWLADRVPRSTLHLACGLCVLTIGASLAWLISGSTLLWPMLFLLGAAAGGTYTLAIVLIGERFRGQDLVTANAGAGLLFGLGSVLGPVVSGGLMQASSAGLPMALSVAAGVFVCTALGGVWQARGRLAAS